MRSASEQRRALPRGITRLASVAFISAGALGTALLGGCGGDSSPATPATPAGPAACAVCTANTLAGVAASGAPLAAASILVIDSLGARKTGTADATGAFSVDVTGLTAPFLIEATGTVGGQVLQYHSLALGTDVGVNQVNVTSLTELMTAIVMGGVPSTLVNVGTLDASKITSAAITSAVSTVQAMVISVLQAAGASALDLRTAQFKADGTGLDLALDGLNVALVNGSYAVSTSTGTSTTSFTPGQTTTSTALSVPDNAASLLGTGTTAQAALAAVMKSLTAQFAGASLPAASALSPFLASDFLHDGQNGSDYVQKILLQDGAVGLPAWTLLGVTFDQVKVTQVIDASNVKFEYRTTSALHYRPWSTSMYATLSNGQWMLRGDQQQFGASVNASATLRETPATTAEMLALGATLYTNATPPFYQLPVKDSAGNLVTMAWLGYPGVNDTFGRLGWIGPDETTPQTRLLRATYPLYFAHPDSTVQLDLTFTIHNNNISSKAASVVVTGPGMPPKGITLVASPADQARDYWILPIPANSGYATNQLGSDICDGFNSRGAPIADCGLDWTQIKEGATYTFVAYDASGAVLDTRTAVLPTVPQQSASQLLAQKEKYFALITPDTSKLFSVTSLYNDATGPFQKGASVKVAWTLPTAPGAQLDGSWNFQQWADPVTGAESTTTLWAPMYGTQPAPSSYSYTVTVEKPPSWMSVGVTTFDVFGNQYVHQADGNNHQ